MRASGVLTVVLATMLSIFTGCGSSSSPANNSPTPRPTPSPTPPPANGTQWSSTVEGATGTVTVSTAGDVTVQVTKAMPSTTYVGNFCQYPGNEYSDRGLNPCFALPSLTTDESGSAQLTFHFPKSGAWAGAFNFAPGGDTNSPSRIGTDNIGTAVTLSSPLVPVSKANGGGPPGTLPPGTQEPGSGSVSISGGNVTVTLKGATPNASFLVGESFSDGGSASQQIGNPFNTDASGNATVTIPALSSSGPIISVARAMSQPPPGFVTGFTVP